MCAVQYHMLGGSSPLILKRKPGYVAKVQGVRREAESEGCRGKRSGRSESEPAVAFHIDDPPYKRGSQLQNIRSESPEG